MYSAEKESFAREEMHRYLLGLGIYPNTACYQALIECVIEAMEKDCLVGCVSEIYNIVGRRCNKSASAIERGLRCGLSKCMSEDRMPVINDYFCYSVYNKKYSLRNGEVISLFASKINEDYRHCAKNI